MGPVKAPFLHANQACGGGHISGLAIQACNGPEGMTWQYISIGGGIYMQEEPLREPPRGESPTKDTSMQDLLQVHQEWEQACFREQFSVCVLHATV